MTQILLVRHAETALKGTFCGHTDPDLSPVGRAQMPDLLEEIRPWPVTLVISSDLQRAQQTAAPIAAQAKVEHRLRPGLREIHFGEWEGWTWQQIEDRHPRLAQSWLDRFPHLPAPDGESCEKFRQRIRRELDYLSGLSSEIVIAVITHAGVIREMLSVGGLAQKDVWQRKLGYGSITRYQIP